MADEVKQQAVDLPQKVTPQKPGKPVEAQALSQMGGTFAERKAAREGKPVKKAKPDERAASTFADRAKARTADEKAVKATDAEDKSVTRVKAATK